MSFKSWSKSDAKQSAEQMLDFDDYFMLNFLAPTYHSAFGHDLNEHYYSNGDITPFIFDVEPNLVSRHNKNNEILANVNVNKAKNIAYDHKLSHKTITIRLNAPGKSGWISKPSKVTGTWFRGKNAVAQPLYWYEFSAGTFKSKSGSNKIKHFVGPLVERPYIHVIDLFEEIEIRSKEKDYPITVDDVLFASRVLCKDDTRSVKRFSVLSDDGSKLVLMAHIDNWST